MGWTPGAATFGRVSRDTVLRFPAALDEAADPGRLTEPRPQLPVTGIQQASRDVECEGAHGLP